MILAISLGYFLCGCQVSGGFTHAPDASDTVRYNRDEFGVRLHVPTGWKGNPVLLFVGQKEALRVAPLVELGGNSFRGRFKATGDPRYAFWVDPAKYKPGATGLIFDQSGLHRAAAPSYFDQVAARYSEVRPPGWPGEGAVFYALDTERFGDGTSFESGAQSFTKHLDYVQSLGVNSIWLNGVHSDSGDVVEDAHHGDWRVVSEASTVQKGADGVAGPTPPESKGWRIAEADDDAHSLIEAGGANGVLDRRWERLVYGFVRDSATAPSTFESSLRSLRSDYPDTVAEQMVLRLAGPGRPRPSAVFRGDRKRLLQVWLLLFTLPGVPVFDAGDEVGLLDSDGPMEWSPARQDSPLLDTVKKLVLARTSRPSLYRGDYRSLDLEDDNHIFAFARVDRLQTTIVMINNSEDSQHVNVPIGQFGSAELRDLYGNINFSVNGTTTSISLPAHGFALIGN